jgi:hypothetical protein
MPTLSEANGEAPGGAGGAGIEARGAALPSRPLADARGDIRALAAIIALTAAAQLWLAHRYFGFLTGDEVEVLAEAFRRARGFPFAPWNIRSLVVPDVVVAPFVWMATKVGINSTRTIIECATLPYIIFSMLCVWCVWRVSERSLIAVLLFATHWIPLGFGSTVYPRNLAMLCVVAAVLLVERHPFVAGALCGVAFADRFSEIVFLIPLLIVARRRGLVALGAAISAVTIVGFYDWATWGMPFASVVRFARLTLLQPDFASRVKYQPPWWYLANLARWLPLTLLPPLWLARRHRLWWFVLIPLAAFSIVRHKELRYLEVLIPFVMILAAIGFTKMPRRWAVPLIVISMAWNLAGLRYFARKSMPAVLAAESLARDRGVGTVTLSQLWAYGDRLYLGERMQVRDVGSPPRDLEHALPGSDAVALWEADLDDASIGAQLRANGFSAAQTFRDGSAKAVVVFRRGPP